MEPNNPFDSQAFAGLQADKLKFLAEFAQQEKPASSRDMASFLTAFAGKAQNQGIRFSDSETDLIVNQLMQNMDPQERRRAALVLQLMKNKRRRN